MPQSGDERVRVIIGAHRPLCFEPRALEASQKRDDDDDRARRLVGRRAARAHIFARFACRRASSPRTRAMLGRCTNT